MQGWIGVDLDGTLAYFDEWKGQNYIGAPVPRMIERVKKWLAEGKDVRIFTARVCLGPGSEIYVDGNIPAIKKVIEDWCLAYIGQVLPITGSKDPGMIELWDDRCKQVIPNTGELVEDLLADALVAYPG